jgi:hypothetical protein
MCGRLHVPNALIRFGHFGREKSFAYAGNRTNIPPLSSPWTSHPEVSGQRAKNESKSVPQMKESVLNQRTQRRHFTTRSVRSKGKGILRQAEVALGVPGRLRPRIFSNFGITRVVGRQPNTGRLYPRRNPWY